MLRAHFGNRSPYRLSMNCDSIATILSIMTLAEIRDALWMVDLFERWGSLSSAEAIEWRRQIEARREFLAVESCGASN